MKKSGLLILVLLLAACSSAIEASNSENNDGAAEVQVVNSPTNPGADSGEVRLNQDYDEALPVDVQLAIGTLQLEETEMAVDETMAADLLPLWRAVQSLTNSDTAAEVEITAVLNQIQTTMSPAQVQTIADMALTQESVNAMIEEGALALGFGRGGAGGGDSEGRPAGGFGGGGVPGGRPPGSGPGGGFPGGQVDPSAIETRQAELAASGDDPFTILMSRGMTNAVIRLLETKTGEITERVNPFTLVLDAVSAETGLTVEEIEAETAVGKSLAEVIEANGGEVTAVQESVIARLGDTPFGQNQGDLTQFISDMLHNVPDPVNEN